MPRRRRHRGSGTYYQEKATKVWIARFPLGGGRFAKRRCATETLARQELERLGRLHNRDIATGTLDDYLAQWISTKVDVRASTRVSYAAHINNHISPLLGGIPVARLRSSDVRRLVAGRLDAGLSPATVRRIHSTLHAALAQGVRDRTLPENVASFVSLPKTEERLVEAMTETDAERIRDAVHGTFLEPLVELLLGSGLRLGEALGLDQGDVNGNVLMVRRTKGHKRAVVISDDAAETLRRHIASQRVRGKDEPVFGSIRKDGSGRLSPSTAIHAFQRYLEAAGLPKMRLHDLRHGAATLMVAQGVHLKVVAAQLGHSSTATTDKFYAHIAPSSLQEAVNLLNRKKA
jgi:integrase